MVSFRVLHAVCLFSVMLLRAWRADCQSNSQLSCSEHLGANKLSSLQPPLKGRKRYFCILRLLREFISIPLTKGFPLILRSTGKEPQICASKMTCCTRQTEDTLRIKAAKKIKTHIQTKYTAAKSSLLSLFDDLKGKRVSRRFVKYFVS